MEKKKKKKVKPMTKEGNIFYERATVTCVTLLIAIFFPLHFENIYERKKSLLTQAYIIVWHKTD